MAERGPPRPADTPREGDDASLPLLERLAHDLRGPLSPLQTAAYLLRRDDIDPERRDELLGIIERQTTRLSAMVQEVSDWARARQSRLVDHREPVAASMLVELACASVPMMRLDLPEHLDTAIVDGDAQRLVQMLSTLLGFMQARAGAASVSVSASRADSEFRVVIAAPGTTWVAGEREALFDSAQATPFDEGLGMRLLLARAIAQAHGGDVEAGESATDGSWLHVRLPLSA